MSYHPCPPSNVSLGNRPSLCRLKRFHHVFLLYVESIDVVQEPVPRFRYDGEAEIARITLRAAPFVVPLNHRVTHRSHAMCICNENGTSEAT